MTARKTDEKTGKYLPQFGEEEFISAVKKGKVVSTREVAKSIGCSYNLALYRLTDLKKRGKIQGKKIGNSTAWWL